MIMIAARISLYHIVSSLDYLAKQGLAIPGKTDSTANFNELLALRATDVYELQSWLSRTKYRWISHDIQNEMLNILADKSSGSNFARSYHCTVVFDNGG